MFDVLKQAAEEASIILKRHFKTQELDVIHKTDHTNIVTQADTESQAKIKEMILNELKKKNIAKESVGFIGEEDLHETGEHIFIIDPVDGTSNFATGVEDYCILIAYFHNQELQSGIMYFPEKESYYYATKGEGAFVSKQGTILPLRLVEKDLKTTFLYTSLTYDADIQAGLAQKIPELKNLFRAVRMAGCAGTDIAYLAENIAGAVIIVGGSIWDLAAGKIILAEMGYGMYDWQGNEMTFDLSQPKKIYPFVACHSKYREQILKILTK